MDVELALRQEAAWLAQSMVDVPESRMRVHSYRPRIEHKLQCPRCWIRKGDRNSLRSVPGSDECDLLRCNYDPCGAEFVIPI